ncbi:MAG: 50S ribosomal protein L32 [Candidatus Latescibacterota bacterium]
MAHPKRRSSKYRNGKRRTHSKLSLPKSNECPNCGQSKLSHRVCGNCGYYNGRAVVVEADEI